MTQKPGVEMDATQFLADLEAGIFAQKVGAAIVNAARGTVDTGKAGQVVITLDFRRVGSSRQVNIKHKLAFTEPTALGKMSEDQTTETPMYVNENGTVTIFPDTQTSMFGAREEENA